MLTFARTPDGRLIEIAALEQLPKPIRPVCDCEACGGLLIPRLGSQKRHHFAHKPDASCYAATSEGALHLDAKIRLAYRAALAIARGKVVVFESRLAGLIGGVLRSLGRMGRLRVRLTCGPTELAWRWLKRQEECGRVPLGAVGQLRGQLVVPTGANLSAARRSSHTASWRVCRWNREPEVEGPLRKPPRSRRRARSGPAPPRRPRGAASGAPAEPSGR